MAFHRSSELHSQLSGNDAIRLLEIIHQSTSCEDKKDFISLFPALRELLPFDFGVAILGARHKRKFTPSGVIDLGFPEAFSREYASRNYLQKDLLVKECFESRHLRYWPRDWDRLRQKKEIISLCLDHHMRFGYIHGASSNVPRRNQSLFSFSGTSLKHDARMAAILELAIPHLHAVFCHVLTNERSHAETITLSPREKEVLNWLQRGKSSWEISVILAISERTVIYHVTNIMRKLDARNRPQAVAIAIRLGLIDLD
jgi:DNA-binding CsgD family transcriptional regulator